MTRLSALRKLISIGLIYCASSLSTSWADTAVQLGSELFQLKTDLVAIEQSLDQQVGDDRLVVYLDMEKMPALELHSVVLFIDGMIASSVTIDPAQQASFDAGGIQKFYVGAMPPGKHKMVAKLMGKLEEPYQHEMEYMYDKKAGASVLRLSIVDVLHQKQSEYIFKPEFKITPEQE